MRYPHFFKASMLAAAVAGLALAGCSREDNRSAGQQLDSAVAKAEQRTDDGTAAVKKELDQARSSTEAAADKATAAMGRAADTVAGKIDSAATTLASKVADASITASVNAELAKDPALSALRINVDTTDGQVLLKGTAPRPHGARPCHPAGSGREGREQGRQPA